jgi:hypothetical protein
LSAKIAPERPGDVVASVVYATSTLLLPGAERRSESKAVEGRVRAVLVGGLEGNGRGHWLRKLERGRVVERVNVDPGEEAGRVGRLARLSERAGGERRLPACGR